MLFGCHARTIHGSPGLSALYLELSDETCSLKESDFIGYEVFFNTGIKETALTHREQASVAQHTLD